MTTARGLHHTYEYYLEALERSDVKLEYCDGEIYALAGGTPARTDLAAAAIRLLGNALAERCRVSTSDLKVRIEATGLSTFPDVTVVCGEREVSAIDRNAITNPTLLLEITSDSTEDYDRGEKLRHFKQCASLLAVLFVSRRRRQVTVVSRNPSGWDTTEYRAGERAVIEPLSFELEVDALYAGVQLEG